MRTRANLPIEQNGPLRTRFISAMKHAVIVLLTCHFALVSAQPPTAQTAAEHRKQGLLYYQQSDMQKALTHFRLAVQADPNDAESHDYIGLILAESGQVAAAIPEFRRAIEINRNLYQAHYHLALAYDQTKREDGAIAHYEQALRIKADFVPARYGLSSICAKRGDLDGAIHLLRQVIQAAPTFAQARYNLGLALWRKYRDKRSPQKESDVQEAENEFRQATQLEPREPRHFVALGELLADKGKLSQAVEVLHTAVTLAPEHAEYRYNLGLALRMKGDVQAAEQELRKALQLDPTHVAARRALGLVLRQRGDFQAAATELRRAIDEQPRDAEVRHNLGTVLLRLNDVAGAIEQLRQAVRLEPYFSEARLTQALQRAGRTGEAQIEQEEARRIDTLRANRGRATVLLQAGLDHLKSGNVTEALSVLREAVRLSPDFAEAHYQLAVALWQSSSDMSEVVRELNQAVEWDPDHARTHLQLGLVHEQQGRLKEAQARFRRAIGLAPGLLEARRALARTAAQMSDWPTAISEYESILAWDPADAQARKGLEEALRERERQRSE